MNRVACVGAAGLSLLLPACGEEADDPDVSQRERPAQTQTQPEPKAEQSEPVLEAEQAGDVMLSIKAPEVAPGPSVVVRGRVDPRDAAVTVATEHGTRRELPVVGGAFRVRLSLRNTGANTFRFVAKAQGHERVEIVRIGRPQPSFDLDDPVSSEEARTFEGRGLKNVGDITISEESVLEWVCKGGRFAAADESGRIDISEWATFGQEPVKPGTYSNLLVDGDGKWTFRIRAR